jgi:hypothetical protein
MRGSAVLMPELCRQFAVWNSPFYIQPDGGLPPPREVVLHGRGLRAQFFILGLASSLALIAPSSAGAQIGRFPVLSALPKVGKCKFAPAEADLRKQGIMTVTSFTNEATGRTVSVSADAKGHPATMTAFIGIQVNTHAESEYAIVFFASTGKVARGTRSYSSAVGSATPASQVGKLLPADSSLAQQLASELLKRCN